MSLPVILVVPVYVCPQISLAERAARRISETYGAEYEFGRAPVNLCKYMCNGTHLTTPTPIPTPTHTFPHVRMSPFLMSELIPLIG